MVKRHANRRVIVAALVAVFVGGALAATAVAQSQRFPDVSPDHEAYEAIEWAAEVGVTLGYKDGTFKPERPLHESHAVVFMERFYDEILQASESPGFTRGDMMRVLKAINDGGDTNNDPADAVIDDISSPFAGQGDKIFQVSLPGERWWAIVAHDTRKPPPNIDGSEPAAQQAGTAEFKFTVKATNESGDTLTWTTSERLETHAGWGPAAAITPVAVFGVAPVLVEIRVKADDSVKWELWGFAVS